MGAWFPFYAFSGPSFGFWRCVLHSLKGVAHFGCFGFACLSF